MDLTGKVAIVTGAAGGIGRATVRRLAEAGAVVVAADRDGDGAQRVLDGIAGARGWAAACDVGDEEQVAACVRGAIDRYGRLDVVVNNAGRMVVASIEDHTTTDWLDVLRVDLLGAFYFVREAFRVMQGGAIVNVASVHAIETTARVAAYAAAKAALVSLTHSAAIEGRPKGIRANAVLPGAIDTPMLWDNPNLKSGLEQVRTTEVGRPEDVAEVILFLASPASAFVDGAALLVDGGRASHL